MEPNGTFNSNPHPTVVVMLEEHHVTVTASSRPAPKPPLYGSLSALQMPRKSKRMLPAKPKLVNFPASFWRLIKNKRKPRFCETIKTS